MPHISPESSVQTLPVVQGQESVVEISLVSPDRDCWQSVDYTFGGPRYEASVVATRALDYFVETTWPAGGASVEMPAPDACQLSDKLRDCLGRAGSAALDTHDRRLVAQAVELLAWQSPAELKSNPRLTQYAGYVVAARQCVTDFPELDDKPNAADVPDDSVWARPEVVHRDPGLGEQNVVAVQPDKTEERINTWHHSLKLGPLTLSLTLQRNNG